MFATSVVGEAPTSTPCPAVSFTASQPRLSNDEVAAALKQYDGVIWKMALYYARMVSDPPNRQVVSDLRDEAVEAWGIAWLSFDPTRGTKFSSYATWRTKGKMSDCVRVKINQMRPQGSRVVSLASGDHAENPGEFSRRIDLRKCGNKNIEVTRDSLWPQEKWQSLLNLINHEDREAWWLHYHDCLSIADTAHVLALSRAAVCYKLRRSNKRIAPFLHSDKDE